MRPRTEGLPTRGCQTTSIAAEREPGDRPLPFRCAAEAAGGLDGLRSAVPTCEPPTAAGAAADRGLGAALLPRVPMEAPPPAAAVSLDDLLGEWARTGSFPPPPPAAAACWSRMHGDAELRAAPAELLSAATAEV